MNAARDAWKEVGAKVEGLGLKLKLHLEQERDHAVTDREKGDTENAFDELADRVSEAFEAFGNAARDAAVKADVRDIAESIKTALVDTFNAAGAEVGEAMERLEDRAEKAAEKVARAVKPAEVPAADADADVIDAEMVDDEE